MAARWDLSDAEASQRDARDSFRILRTDRAARPARTFDGSLEAANRDAALRVEVSEYDLYDLCDDGREPW